MKNGTKLLLAAAAAGLLAVIFFVVQQRGGTEQNTMEQAAGATPRQIFVEPLTLERVESSAQALIAWRPYAGQRPTLVVFTNSPMLEPLPEISRREVLETLQSSAGASLGARLAGGGSDPLLLSTMTVDAALRSGWFGRVVIVVPTEPGLQNLNVDALRKELLANGLVTEEEADSLRFDGQQIVGVLRDIPVSLVSLERLPPLTTPVLIHFEQNYFQQMYKDEIKTPVMSLVHQTLSELRDRHLPALAATFCNGNVDGGISLEVRFLADLLGMFVEQPERFDQSMPPVWEKQRDILYLENFFQPEKIHQLALDIDTLLPETGWAKFNLYRSFTKLGRPAKAQEALAQAVDRDKIFALEYRTLAAHRYEEGEIDEAQAYLRLARIALPGDAQLLLEETRLCTERGDWECAGANLDQLRKLPWSRTYYPSMSADLSALEKLIAEKNN